jgi:hypothetical protein
MSFQTFIPSDILKPFVKSFAISENEKADSYKVLPVEYKLSEKGLAFLPILESIKEWNCKYEVVPIHD